jgi:hypothetical protein
MSQKILEFNIAQDKQVAIHDICARLGIEPIVVARRDYAQKLGVLAGVKGFKKEKIIYTGSELPAEMMVFSEMTSDMIDDFLAAYKEAGLVPVALKAVVTPGNIRWNVEELFRELLREHLAITGK